jgi:hypothetical protein
LPVSVNDDWTDLNAAAISPVFPVITNEPATRV